MSDRVSVEIDGGVADVRLNRPEKMNALDQAMFDALVDTGDRLALDSGLRAIVLSGEGRAFCAGLDFGGFQAMADGPSERGRGVSPTMEGRITHRGQQAAWTWAKMPVPVIAAVHGVALGGGIQIALAADIRIVAPDARLSVLEVRWGLTPDMTGTKTLVELVGVDRAKELTFTGRMVEGAEAVEIGLATRLADDPRHDAFELAREIARKSPDAVRAAKRLLSNASQLSPADAFGAEREEIGALIGSPNQVEAVAAYFDERDAVFADPET